MRFPHRSSAELDQVIRASHKLSHAATTTLLGMRPVELNSLAPVRCCWVEDRPRRADFLPASMQPRSGKDIQCSTTQPSALGVDECANFCEASEKCSGFIFANMRCTLRTESDRAVPRVDVTDYPYSPSKSASCYRGRTASACIRLQNALCYRRKALAPSCSSPVWLTATRQGHQRPIREDRDLINSGNASSTAVIGIAGGSISVGRTGQGTVNTTYGQVIGEKLGVNVINRASGGVGVARAAMCLDSMFGLGVPLDILLLEYARNDCGSAGSQSPWGPLASMERLLLGLRSSRPQTMPVLLYIFPTHPHPCSSLYTRVAQQHQVLEVSVAQLAQSDPRLAAAWREVSFDRYGHPDQSGHDIAGQLLVAELRRLTHYGLPSRVWPVPWAWPAQAKQLWVDPTFERTDTPWRCATCDQQGCNLLQPRAGSSDGFMARTSGLLKTGVVCDKGKWGWVAYRNGAKIAFDVPGDSRIVLAMLCSYENVGDIRAQLVTLRGQTLLRTVNQTLRWMQRSSQHCYIDLGNTRAGPHVLFLRAHNVPVVWRAGGGVQAAAQVRLYAIYSQPSVLELLQSPHRPMRMSARTLT